MRVRGSFHRVSQAPVSEKKSIPPMNKTSLLVAVPTLAALSLGLTAGSPVASAETPSFDSFTKTTQVMESFTEPFDSTNAMLGEALIKAEADAKKAAAEDKAKKAAAEKSKALELERTAAIKKEEARVADLAGQSRYTTVDTDIRSGAGESHSVKVELDKGDEVILRGEAVDGWHAVDHGDVTGWIDSSNLTKTAPPEPEVEVAVEQVYETMYTVANLNLRVGAGVGHAKLVTIPKGSAVESSNKASGEWVSVKYGDQTGWVVSAHLTSEEPVEESAPATSESVESASSYRTTSSTDAYTRDTNSGVKKTYQNNAVKLDASNEGTGLSAVVSAAYTGIGKPYVFGGKTPSGWDCSGFTSWAYAQAGYSIPSYTRGILNSGQFEKTNNPQPGDLVFQNGGGHVGIYVGNGQMIGAQNPSVGTFLHSVNRNPIMGYYTLKSK